MKPSSFAVAVWAMVSIPAVFSAGASSENRDWDVSLWAQVETGEENLNSLSEAQILSAGLFLGRTITGELLNGWRRGRLEYGISLSPFLVEVRPQTIYGVGFEPVVFRWNSAKRVGRVLPYIELAGGALRTTDNLPRGQTSKFNFTAKGGGGIYLAGTGGKALEIGLDWSHISNANLGLRNPEFNGIALRLAYHWFR